MIKTKLNKRTSTAYQGTTTDYKNDPDVKQLKAMVKGTGFRVEIRGRKPKMKQTVRNYWTGQVSKRGYNFGGNVVGGLANATEFDVYVYHKSSY